MKWFDVKDKLPPQSDIVKAKLDDGREVKAYFYPDAMGWITYYGLKSCHFWDKTTHESLQNVTHWRYLIKQVTESPKDE